MLCREDRVKTAIVLETQPRNVEDAARRAAFAVLGAWSPEFRDL
jgi:hypothetical protein